MKKKFISVAMFLALAVSSPVWVGCADYDDDIANLQSQVDGLKQSVDVTTAEAISALQSAQGELQADIDELVTNTGVTSTDVETLQGQVAALQAALDANNITEATNLSEQIQGLINQINNEVSPELEQVKNDLEQQKSELEGQISAVSEDLAQKEEELKQLIAQNASQEDINGLQEQINTLDGKLEELNEDFVDVSNRFTTVETWYNTNGTELAKLTSKVSQIESLLTYLDAEKQAGIDQVTDPEVLAEILKLETTNDAVTTLQQQIGDAATENTILYRLAELEGWKNNLMTELFKGSEYSSILDIQGDIKELQDALLGSAEGEEPTAGIQEQLNAIKAQMAKYDMIQSVVYVPNGDAYQLTTSVLKVWNGTDYVEVAQGVNNNTIDFRVSPASLAKDFIGENPKYALTFDGQKVKAFNNVEVDGEPTMVDETAGIIRYKVKTQFEAGSTYAVCAVIKGIESAGEAEGETVAADGTDLTTTYFLAKSEIDEVDEVIITSPNGSKTEMPYENPDGTPSSINYGEGIVVAGWNRTESPSAAIVPNLVEKYGVPTTIEYTESNDVNNWFQVSTEGVLTLTNPSNAMIGRSVQITPVAVFEGGIRLTSTQPFAQVTVTRRVVEHHVAEVKNISWSKDDQFIALTTAEMDEIIDKTELSRGDYNELWTRNQPSSKPTTITLITGEVLKANATAWSLTLPSGIDMANRDNTLYLYIPAEANVNIGGELKVTLYDGSAQGSSTTQTDSYEIYVNYNAMTYPITTIEWNSARWDGTAGYVLNYQPQLGNPEGALSSVGNQFDAKDLFANYSALKSQVEALGATLNIEMANTVTGITEQTNEIYEYAKNTYKGAPMTLNIYIDYNGHREAATSCVVNTENLSGTWKNPNSMNLGVDNLSQTYNIAAGAQWSDIRGKVMWENGSAANTGTNTNFSTSPFAPNDDLYYLTTPSFSIVAVNGQPATSSEYVTVNNNGIVSFTDAAKQLTFATSYEVTIRISADSPWGAIDGMTAGQNGAADYVDVTLTINQGASAY